MTVNNPASPSLIATNVWNNATRTLTGLGASLVNGVGDSRVTVTNGTTVSLQPPIGAVEIVLALGNALTNVTWIFQMTNGTNVDPFVNGTSGSGTPTFYCQNRNFYSQVNNAGTVSGTFDTMRIRFIN